MREGPDRIRSLASYARLAGSYDASSRHILGIREAALAALAPAPGETIFDVACGTGPVLARLAEAVGTAGRVLGIEHSPEMAAVARERIAACHPGVRVVVTSIEELDLGLRADAMLLCYTHDVLQSPQALERLARHANPGCRVVVTGIRFLPWWWGFPVNVFTAIRTRRYLTTYRGLGRPWAELERLCPDFRVLKTFHAGSSYLGSGRFARG